jgi:hypothetical protein
MDMIESTITKIEYLTSRQVASCENGDLVKRNLNLLPVRARATFCHPFKMNLRIKINKRKRTAIFNPVKFSIILFIPPHPNPLPQGEKGQVKENQIDSIVNHPAIGGNG